MFRSAILYGSFMTLGWAHPMADFNGWQFSRTWTLNTTPSGANVAGSVMHIPIVVRLNAGNFDFNQAKNLGEDIRFAKPDGTPLPYQVERWDKPGRIAAIWVKLDTVYGNSLSQSFRMYWGNAGAAEASAPSAVFDTSDAYAAVWHLGEKGNTDPEGYRDATYDGADGQGKNLTAANTVEGVVGYAQFFHPNQTGGQSVMIKDAKKTLFDFTGPMTVAHWVRVESKDGVTRYTSLAKGEGAWRMYRSNAQTFEFCVTQNGKGPNGKDHDCVGTHNRFGGAPAWVYVVGVNQGPRLRIYVNGALDGDTAAYGTPVKNAQVVGIGQNNQGSFFRGAIDEAQVLRKAVDPDWVKLSYETQRPDGKLLSYSTSASIRASRGFPYNRSGSEPWPANILGRKILSNDLNKGKP